MMYSQAVHVLLLCSVIQAQFINHTNTVTITDTDNTSILFQSSTNSTSAVFTSTTPTQTTTNNHSTSIPSFPSITQFKEQTTTTSVSVSATTSTTSAPHKTSRQRTNPHISQPPARKDSSFNVQAKITLCLLLYGLLLVLCLIVLSCLLFRRCNGAQRALRDPFTQSVQTLYELLSVYDMRAEYMHAVLSQTQSHTRTLTMAHTHRQQRIRMAQATLNLSANERAVPDTKHKNKGARARAHNPLIAPFIAQSQFIKFGYPWQRRFIHEEEPMVELPSKSKGSTSITMPHTTNNRDRHPSPSPSTDEGTSLSHTQSEQGHRHRLTGPGTNKHDQ